MVNFGKRLKMLRKESRMTQDELARKLNVTKSIISYYELGDRTPSTDILIKLAYIFNVINRLPAWCETWTHITRKNRSYRQRNRNNYKLD